jgi:predicted MFS family arabinose efflux permease
VGVSVSVVLDVTHPGLRSTGAAVHACAINLFGLAVGPFVGGVISDLWSLNTALTAIPVVGFLSAAFYWKASRSYEADMKTVAAMVREEPAAQSTPNAWAPAAVVPASS